MSLQQDTPGPWWLVNRSHKVCISLQTAHEVACWLGLCGDVHPNPGPRAPSQTCVCCSTAPVLQKGNVEVFPSVREVFAWIANFRSLPGKSKKSIKDMMCGSNSFRPGGTTCREEGGCHFNDSQCLEYYITAPYFKSCLQFVIDGKYIKDKIDQIKHIKDKVDKHKTKTSEVAMRERTEYEALLEKTFPVLLNNVRDLVQACPNRYLLENLMFYFIFNLLQVES